MKGLRWALVGITLGVTLMGCADDKEAPSCQEAFTHFYAAGCFYRDNNTQQDIPRDTMISRCETAARTAPSKSCKDRLDDWLICQNEVPDTARSAADCDCSAEQMAILTCED